ncbi:beta-N-acetylhexosaminidase [Burkholderiales bacterium]|nr:beta-N-acetylhexosaminidase [Burkholderiales bacterium]
MTGRIIIDVPGIELTQIDVVRIRKSSCAGVILFSRNFHNKEQLKRLIQQIKAVKSAPLLICVDQEGGRVQRFKKGFTEIPPMACLGEIWDRDQEQACSVSYDVGIVLGAELKDMGVDLTFAPVLDINRNKNSVIGDRSFHADVEAIIELGKNFIKGLSQTGVGSVGKHFPGHGGVSEDTHLNGAVDNRDLSEILRHDAQPFAELAPVLCGMMPAHVSFPKVDVVPACFSRNWLQDVLRKQLDFQGLIFSDDLSMRAATLMGDIRLRSSMAFKAGCDLLLVCNDPASADEVLNIEENMEYLNDQIIDEKIKALMNMPIHLMFGSDNYTESLARVDSACNEYGI